MRKFVSGPLELGLKVLVLSVIPLLTSPWTTTTSTHTVPGTCIVPRAVTHALNRGAECQAQLAFPLSDAERWGCDSEGGLTGCHTDLGTNPISATSQ